VGGPAVGLDDQVLVAPEEVSFVSPDSNVHLGRWQAVVAAEAEKELLQVAAGAVGAVGTSFAAVESSPI
jgi:hypothetical protein